MTYYTDLYFPKLDKGSGRYREIRECGEDKVAIVIYQHLFFGKGHREIDREILNRPISSAGRAAANILYYYGIKGKDEKNRAKFKGFFKDVTLEDAVFYLEKTLLENPLREDKENIANIISFLKSFDAIKYNKNSYLEEIDIQLISLLNKGEALELYIRDEPKKPIYSDQVREEKVGYGRNAKIAAEAIFYANFLCELNPEHETFLSKKWNKPYLEAHHIIPMKYQYKYPDISLDVHANIVALCPNCHRKIHHGEKFEVCLEFLYEKRKARLTECGINIELKNLINLY